MPQLRPDRRSFVTITVGAFFSAGSGCVGVFEKATDENGNSWTPREEIVGVGTRMNQPAAHPIRDAVNERRFDQGLSALDEGLGISTTMMDEMQVELASVRDSVSIDEDPMYCSGTMATTQTVLSYETKFESGEVKVNTDADGLASDLVDAMEQRPRQREILLGERYETHAASVRIGDHGKAQVAQVFCGRDS